MDSSVSELNRVRWQCRRGMLELDALLETFVDKRYAQLDETQRDVFQKILQYPDQLLFDYFFGNSTPADKEVSDVIKSIRSAATA